MDYSQGDKKPEEIAREIIDRSLEEAGWRIVDRKDYAANLHAVALREAIMNGNKEADYLLFIEGKAIGVIEAKRMDRTLDSTVADQAENYSRITPDWYQKWFPELPMVILANGVNMVYRDQKSDNEEYDSLQKMFTPKQISERYGLGSAFSTLPMLSPNGLRECQFEALSKLEEHFRSGNNRALIELATGAGKTFTACLASYRFLKYTTMRRVLFLVDRTNLGKQAESAFGNFKLTENGKIFNTIYEVQRLKGDTNLSGVSVVISTIQGLFAKLTGQSYDEPEDEESDFSDDDNTPIIPISDAKLQPNFFDLIIIDECHRSIYGKWRSVLEYFKEAKMIGLTATPGPDTYAFFNAADEKPVSRYSYEQSVADNVNVGYRIFRIKTDVTENGGVIRKDEEVDVIGKKNRDVSTVTTAEEMQYRKNDLNRVVVNPSQIKTVLEAYKNAVYTQLFNDPQREPLMEYLPKTLIFAADESHAQRIVSITKEVFPNQDEKFVQQITYSQGNSEQLIKEFNNDKKFRIAVTVTLVATGTDVPPLEVVMFMRDVRSDALYRQMKGRGCRSISDDKLRIVTPNAISKDVFYVVDAVGATESEKTSGPTGGPTSPYLSLKELLEKITHGYILDEYLDSLASKISRINHKASIEQREKFYQLSGGYTMKSIVESFYKALENSELPPFVDVNDDNIERKSLVAPLANNPEAREYLLELNEGFITILKPGEDTLISATFSYEDAQKVTNAFEKYLNEHHDEIEALRILYNDTQESINYAMLKDLRDKLRSADTNFTTSVLWNHYSLLDSANVVKPKDGVERDMLTNIIQLVRYALKKIDNLRPLSYGGSQYFNLWQGHAMSKLKLKFTAEQVELLKQISIYILANGFCKVADIAQYNRSQAIKFIEIFDKDAAKANEALASMSSFMIYQNKVS